MNTKLYWFVTLVIVPACAHQQATPHRCPDCPIMSAVCDDSAIEQVLDLQQKSCGDYKELNDIHDKSIAYMDRWNTSFSKISEMVIETFSYDFNEEDDAVNDKSRDNYVRYKIEFIGGVMHISFSDEQLFAQGNSTLKPLGRSIVLKMAEVLESADQRHVTIACRTTVGSEGKNKTQWLSVRELSSRRSVAIMAVMEKSGINPRFLAAASLSNYSEEDALERATTTFIIYPSAREAPRYPNQLK